MKKLDKIKTDVTIEVGSLVEVIKTSIANSLIENANDLKIDTNTLKKINVIIENSIRRSYINGIESVHRKFK